MDGKVRRDLAKIRRVTSQAHMREVVSLAREIWTEHYLSIIGRDQVDYMLEKFQSATAIAAQIAEGYEYYLLAAEGGSVGYLALVPDADGRGLMISKLYVLKPMRGRGYAKQMLAFVEDVCRERGVGVIWLTVNKRNVDSLTWYERRGFVRAGALVQDIGEGFVMDDYRMEKKVGAAWNRD